MVKHFSAQVCALSIGTGVQEIIKYEGAFMFFIRLRFQIPDHTGCRLLLKPIPVRFRHQVKAVESVLFIVKEKVPCLKHTVWACCSETSQDLVCQQLSSAYTFFKEFRLLNGCSYETRNRVVCLYINRFFRNTVKDFGNSAFF